MIVIERRKLRNQLRQDLRAATYRSADTKCRNQLGPLGNLCRALHHCTIVLTRLAKSIRETLDDLKTVRALVSVGQQSTGDTRQNRHLHFVRVQEFVQEWGLFCSPQRSSR